MKISDKLIIVKRPYLCCACCLMFIVLLLSGGLSVSHAASNKHAGYASPEDAVKALVDAVRAGDKKKMIMVLGPGSKDLISSGDEVEDKTGQEKFLKAFDEMNSLEEKASGSKTLVIGKDRWPMPIPIVKKTSRWTFDVKQGKKEILNRRIGRNELHVIDVLHAYVGAQHEYATKNCSGSKAVEFAQRLVSSKGKHDGLYWDAKEGEQQSPLGPLVAQAAKEGYMNADLSPFHGYYFKILKGQGKYADGGAYNFVVGKKMILGFALVAYPATYGNSGVMTFIVNQSGMIYQKDLGKNTLHAAETLTVYNPDSTWTKVAEKSKTD